MERRQFISSSIAVSVGAMTHLDALAINDIGLKHPELELKIILTIVYAVGVLRKFSLRNYYKI